MTVTGGTYSNGTAIFTNNTGGTNVTGFSNSDVRNWWYTFKCTATNNTVWYV
jgi:hypothetical protein